MASNRSHGWRWLLLAAGLALAAIIVGAELPSKLLPPFLRRTGHDYTSPAFLFWKSMHVLGFAALSTVLTLLISAKRGRKFADMQTLLAVAAVTLTVSFLKEEAQNFSPGRVPRVTDVGFDLIGISIGMGIAWLYNLQKTWKRELGLYNLIAPNST